MDRDSCQLKHSTTDQEIANRAENENLRHNLAIRQGQYWMQIPDRLKKANQLLDHDTPLPEQTFTERPAAGGNCLVLSSQ
jgi:hypothetical protein